MARRHLLIVDDSTLVTDALRVLFELNGYQVSVADGVDSAVQYATASPPYAMLLDLTLSDGDGLSVLSRLQEDGVALPRTVALTGDDDDAMRARCLAAGCRAILVKPVPTQELLELVRSL